MVPLCFIQQWLNFKWLFLNKQLSEQPSIFFHCIAQILPELLNTIFVQAARTQTENHGHRALSPNLQFVSSLLVLDPDLSLGLGVDEQREAGSLGDDDAVLN